MAVVFHHRLISHASSLLLLNTLVMYVNSVRNMTNYPYDAVSAATVRMKDITSSAQNRALLHQIKNNSPSLTDLTILGANDDADFFHGVTIVLRQGDDLGWLGYFIGENETLKKLSIHHISDQEQVENFFIGLQRNKSIENIYFHRHRNLVGTLGESLSAINLPHVTTLSIGNLDHEEARSFAVGLQRCKSLVEYYGPMTSEIVASLATLLMLEKVMLWRLSNEDMAIGPDECTTLRDLLTYATNMKHLHISFTLGSEGLTILASFLAVNTKLRVLILSDNNIGDAGLEALADALVRNRALRVLSIAKNTAITVTGARSLSRILESGTSRLQDLRLDGVNISYEGWSILAGALPINNSLVSLSLQNWWGGESIGDDELRALTLGLSQNSHLKSLNLSKNTAITASGLRFLEEYLGSPSCALEDLSLFGINIGDKGARALADALRRNSSLKTLYFSERGITLKGWKSFLKLVCDSSSPNSLYLSNHTLCDLGDNLNPSTSHVKNLIGAWLKVNNDYTPNVAAKTKILPFFYEIDMMVPLFHWDLKLLPVLKLWFNILSENHEFEASIRNNELSCIYKFVRGFPMLVGDNLRRNLARQVERIRTEEEESSLMQG